MDFTTLSNGTSDRDSNNSAAKHSSFKNTLLLVDDKPDNLTVLEAVFGSEYNLFAAMSGEEALELLQTNDVDVILLDIQMPGIDGYETARRIKQIERCKMVPIVFITAVFSDNPYIKKGYEVGGIDYFTKPFDPDILKVKIAAYAAYRQSLSANDKERHRKESEELVIADKYSQIHETMKELKKLKKDLENKMHDLTDHSHMIKAIQFIDQAEQQLDLILQSDKLLK